MILKIVLAHQIHKVQVPYKESISLASQPLIEKRKRVWSHCVRAVVSTPRSWRDQSDSLIIT